MDSKGHLALKMAQDKENDLIFMELVILLCWKRLQNTPIVQPFLVYNC